MKYLWLIILFLSCDHQEQKTVSEIREPETSEVKIERVKQEIAEKAKPVYIKALAKINELNAKFDLAANGTISKKEALFDYNNSVGENLGKTNSFDFARKRLSEAGEAYAEVLYKKEQARLLFEKSAEEKSKTIDNSK